MCKPDPQPTAPLAAANLAAPPTPPRGSRRWRLWELPHSCHCPVVGVCLSIKDVRRLLDQLFGGQSTADDYGLHVGTVRECASRNRVSELLQRELDRRYALVQARFAIAKTAEQLGALWAGAVRARDIAGPLWATLTHSRCDTGLQEAVLQQVHMIQHQAGAEVRAEAREVRALVGENARLVDALSRAQQRALQAQADRAAEQARLSAELMRLRAEAIASGTVVAGLRAELEQARRAAPDLASRDALTRRVAALAQRVRELQDVQRLAAHPAFPEACAADTAANGALPAPVGELDEAIAVPRLGLALASRNVLCVGGRSGHIPTYRALVERHGGRFAHHDGGLEDNPRRLGASLAAADLVVCQAGCLSHNAYGVVKEHCKRTGKVCIYLDRPSAASFAQGLAQATAPRVAC